MKRIVWHSTLLGRIDRHCLAVMCFDAGEDRRIFESGKVAHFVLEQAQRATNDKGAPLDVLEIPTVCEKAMAATAEHGFKWRGKAEPPPRPDAAVRGRRLAERWLYKYPPEPGMLAEVSFALDRAGRLVEYEDPSALMAGILDVAGVIEVATEDDVYTAVRIEDHKSDWPSGSGKDEDGILHSLDNVQRRLQALGAAEMFAGEDYSALILALNNLPRLWRFERPIMYDEMGILDVWRQELVALVEGYGARTKRFGLDPEKLASPGVGCLTCAALGQCAPGRRHMEKRKVGDPLEEIAASYAAHMAETWRLKPWIQSACDEIGVVVFGETEVGYEEKEETVVAKNAAEVVWRYWKREHREGVDDAQDYFERDLLQTYLGSLQIGIGELESLLRKLWPGNRGSRPERERKMALRRRILDEVTQKRLKPKFGIRRIPPPEPTLEEQLRASLEPTNGNES